MPEDGTNGPRRRVLMVSYFFPPLGGGGVQRILQTVRYLPRFGWDPVVLTVQDGDWTSTDQKGLGRIPPSVQVERTPFITAPRLKEKLFGRREAVTVALPTAGWEEFPSTLREKIISRLRPLWQTPDEFLGWYPYAVRKGRELLAAGRFDAIISSGPPWTCHLIGRALAKESGLPWVADFRDGWTLMPGNSHGAGLQGRIERRLEKPVVEEAAGLVFTNDQMRQDYVRHYGLDPGRTHTVTNGFDPDEFSGAVIPRKEFVLFYGGTTFGGQRIELLFPALARLKKKHPDAGVRFEYAGVEGPALRAKAEQAGFGEGFIDLGYLPHVENILKLRQAAVLPMVFLDAEIARAVYPGKLFEILAASRPVLYAGRDGSTADLLRELGTGVCVIGQPGLPDVDRALDEALEGLLAGHRTGTAMPAVTRIEIQSRFSRVELTRQYAGLLDGLVPRDPPVSVR